MKNNFLSLLALAFLFSTMACSSSETDSSIAGATEEVESIEITSRSLESENNEEDINFLLVQKWQDESGAIFLDLKIDGTFEGKINDTELIYGAWEITEDQKTLKLNSNKSGEGKGSGFNAVYSIVEMSFESMKVKDAKGKELSFSALK